MKEFGPSGASFPDAPTWIGQWLVVGILEPRSRGTNQLLYPDSESIQNVKYIVKARVISVLSFIKLQYSASQLNYSVAHYHTASASMFWL